MGFESGGIDLSGIGYNGSRMLFYFGRGRQILGAGHDIYLFQTEGSNSFDHFSLIHKSKNFKTKYFHGFLENINDYNRYMVGKSFEIKILNDAMLSFSEISIYSGKNRPLDLAYLNPLYFHLDLEFNNQSNRKGKAESNAIWQTSVDWLYKDRYRFSFNYIIDELILDKVQIDSGKVNGVAFSSRLALINKGKKYFSNIFLSYLFIGSNTFSHEHGYNNFFHRGSLLVGCMVLMVIK